MLGFRDLPLEPPAPGQLLVRNRVVGVNFIDTYQRSGVYPLELPARLGQEAVGIVEQVGSGVRDVDVGQRVAYVSCLGAYAERHLIPSERAIQVPDDLDDASVAAALLKGMTVEYLIGRTFRVERGQTVLWHAAAGGTGLLACQWLAELGVRVIGTVGSDAKAELALAHGCAEAIVYTRENFVERVRELTGGAGVPVVFDSVGRSTFEGSLDCLKPRGMLVSFGNASGKPSLSDVTLLARKGSLFLTRPTLAHYTESTEELRASARALFEVMRRGAVRPVIGQRFALSEVREAHAALEARRTVGSTILLVDQG
ncbi:MAG TPA: quinone oxidoreductase [Aggregatilineales bacterium]|nr:quinone oxidoreductase [Aggregatilineales bacterium]